MASEQERILETLAAIVAAHSGGVGRVTVGDMAGSRGRDESYKQRTAADRKLEASVHKAEAAAKGMSYTTKVLPKKLQEVLNKSGSDFAKGIAAGAKKFEDVFKIEDQAKAMAAVAAKMKAMKKTEFESKDELDKHLADLSEIAKKAGLTLEDMGIKGSRWKLSQKKNIYFIDAQSSATERLTKESEELADALDEAEFETRRHSAQVEHSKAKLKKLGDAIKYVTKDFLKFAEAEQRYAQQTATADAGWIKGITDMGISQLDYMKLLKETRVESLAAANAGVDFTAMLTASQNSLIGYTATTEEAARVAGMNYKNMARMGVSQEQLGDAVLQQTEIYKKNYRALGYTAEQFASLSAELINEQGMRSTLLNLQEKERRTYIIGIQQRMAEYQTMGYTIERAKELQKTFQALGEMSPVERMKKAAKKRAMMGAMGMGTEGEELMRLEMAYKTMNAEDKLKAEKRMTEIQKEAAARYGEMTGAGATIGQSMAMQMMGQKTGFADVAKTFEAESGKGLKVSKDQLKTTNEINKTVSKILEAMSFWGAASNSAIGSLGTNLLTGLGGILGGLIGGKMLGGIISKFTGGGPGKGGIGKMLKGAVGKMRGGIATMAGAVGLGGLNTGVGTVVGKGKEAVAKGETGVVKGAKSAAGSVGKTMGKSAFKSGIKKIPVIGALAAIGFGMNRAMSGDWLGAAGEVASGVSSIIPGLGTATSVGIDATLAARDIARSDEGVGKSATKKEATPPGALAEEPKTVVRPMTQAARYDEQQKLLISTLQELQAYLKTMNHQSSEQVGAVTRMGEATIEGIRFNSWKGARPA